MRPWGPLHVFIAFLTNLTARSIFRFFTGTIFKARIAWNYTYLGATTFETVPTFTPLTLAIYASLTARECFI